MKVPSGSRGRIPRQTITLKRIAEMAGVSMGTVSNVLNGSVKVSSSRRKRVEEIIRQFDYQPSQVARAMRRQSTDIIGVLIPDITNPFFPSIVRGVEDCAFKLGFRLVLCNTDDDAQKEFKYFEDLRSLHPAGVLVIPCEKSLLKDACKEDSRHIIFVDRCPAWWTGAAVVAEAEDGGYQAGTYLACMGHRVIGAIEGPHGIESAQNRMRGFKRALAEAKIRVLPKYIQEAPFTPEGGLAATMRLMAMTPRPTAIFASSDRIAAGVLAALRRLELRCPDDVSVVGFDDLDFAQLTDPPLTTVFQPAYQMGALACEILLDRIRNNPKSSERRTLKTELKIRDSVRHAERTININPTKRIRQAVLI